MSAALLTFVLHLSAQDPVVTAEQTAPAQPSVVDQAVLIALIGKSVDMSLSDGTTHDGVLILSVDEHGAVVQFPDRSVSRIVSASIARVVVVAPPSPSQRRIVDEDKNRPQPRRARIDSYPYARPANVSALAAARKLEDEAVELGDQAFQLLLGGGLVGGVGMLGFAVSLFLPLTAVGVGCLGSSCLAIATGGVLATVGAVKNGDAAEKRRGAARLRSDRMAY